MTSKPLHALQFAYQNTPWEVNLQTLLLLLNETKAGSLTLAPELCLTGYPYTQMSQAAAFSQKALPQLQEASKGRQIGLTMVIEENGYFFNRFVLLNDTKVEYTQNKAKLFPLGDEPSYFHAGATEAIGCLTCKDETVIGVLICFELRFTSLWEQLKGADIILVPAFWGKERQTHYVTLCRALAIANQCYVIAANSSDETMCAGSAIIDPFGEVITDNQASRLDGFADTRKIKTMRRYITIGL